MGDGGSKHEEEEGGMGMRQQWGGGRGPPGTRRLEGEQRNSSRPVRGRGWMWRGVEGVLVLAQKRTDGT